MRAFKFDLRRAVDLHESSQAAANALPSDGFGPLGFTSTEKNPGLKMREGGEAGSEMARNSGSQLLLSSSHQVA